MENQLKYLSKEFSPYCNDENLKLEIIANLNEFQYFHIYLFLVDQLNMEIEYGGEKTAWFIRFNYSNLPYSISLMKSGLLLFGKKDSPETTIKLLNSLRKTKKYINPIYESKSKEKINNREITIRNSYHFLYSRYEFNLNLFSRIENDDYIYKKNMIKDVVLLYAFLNLTESWFGWLEHILILLFPLSNKYMEFDFMKFISSDWTTKFNFVFADHRILLKYYNKLKQIKEQFRNTFTHGGIRKNNSEILVHWKGIGAIPYILSDTDIYPDIKFQCYSYDFNKEIDIFNSFHFDLANDDTKLKYMFISSGIDIYCSIDDHKNIVDALKSENQLYDYIEYINREQEAAMNFE